MFAQGEFAIHKLVIVAVLECETPVVGVTELELGRNELLEILYNNNSNNFIFIFIFFFFVLNIADHTLPVMPV